MAGPRSDPPGDWFDRILDFHALPAMLVFTFIAGGAVILWWPL